MSTKLTVVFGVTLFALLSAGDWALTYAILSRHPEAIESNPVAAAFLGKHGWYGLAVYKAGAVSMFFGVVFLLLRRRPIVAARTVGFGCATLLCVLAYSHQLLAGLDEQVARDRRTSVIPDGAGPRKKLSRTFPPQPSPPQPAIIP